MATDTASLVPAGVAREVIESASQQSVVMRLGRVISMPAGTMNIPLVSVVPSAEFVASGGRKPITTIEWTAEKLVPHEIAATAYIPDDFLDDAGFPVWESVRDELAAAIGRTLDRAVLFGTGAPASFPAGGVSGAGAAIVGTDVLDAIDKGLAAVEVTGLAPTGVAAHLGINSALRQKYQDIMAMPSEAPAQSVYGLPLAVTSTWDTTKGDAITGDWSKLVIGIRQDVSFDLSTEGVARSPYDYPARVPDQPIDGRPTGLRSSHGRAHPRPSAPARTRWECGREKVP